MECFQRIRLIVAFLIQLIYFEELFETDGILDRNGFGFIEIDLLLFDIFDYYNLKTLKKENNSTFVDHQKNNNQSAFDKQLKGLLAVQPPKKDKK